VSSPVKKRAMIDRERSELALIRQCHWVGLACSTACHRPGTVSEVFNTNQGSQFTSSEWIRALKQKGIQISMDGRGRALGNVFVERLWRSLKYEEVYRREYQGVADLRHHLEVCFHFYNHERPHSSLGGRPPAEIHDQSTRKEVA
jgi:putative transposase